MHIEYPHVGPMNYPVEYDGLIYKVSVTNPIFHEGQPNGANLQGNVSIDWEIKKRVTGYPKQRRPIFNRRGKMTKNKRIVLVDRSTMSYLDDNLQRVLHDLKQVSEFSLPNPVEAFHTIFESAHHHYFKIGREGLEPRSLNDPKLISDTIDTLILATSKPSSEF